MPPLVCPAPDLIDQTFPRSAKELRLIRDALGTLVSATNEEACILLLTTTLSNFIVELEEKFCWEVVKIYPQVQVIYAVLAQLGLQQHGVKRVDVSDTHAGESHPLPIGTEDCPFSPKWATELGNLYVLHSQHCTRDRFFIGVACTSAFGGGIKGRYEAKNHAPRFPLIGPNEITTLDDSMKWDVPADIVGRNIGFKDAYKHVRVLGGDIRNPKGSSHYQVRFKGGRTWPLDANIDPVPNRFLSELQAITSLDLGVIKYVLIEGEWPRRASRI